jgi:tripartite ATP-independent transporter DctM subunit
MSEIAVGIIGIAVLLLLFCTGIEIGFGMAIVGLIGFGYLVSFPAACNLLAQDFFEVFSSYGLTVLPLFILMGQIAFSSGIAKRLYTSAYTFTAHIPGGLAMATVAGATAFGAVCGSMPATAATFSTVAVPQMDRYGYNKSLSTGVVATVGILGVLIPPSSMLIILGIITEQSIGQLFMAGVIPGLLLAVAFIILIYFWCKINPSLGPVSEKYTWRVRLISLKEFIWPLTVFVIVIGGLMKGFFTPTEAGSIGTFAILMLTFATRTLDLKGFVKGVADTIRPSCMIFALIAGSTVLGHFIAMSQIPALAAEGIMTLNLPPWLIMTLIMFVYLLGGSFVDDLAFMILTTPILFPVVPKLGYDPLWFCIILTITLGIGVIIPPVAVSVFIVKNFTNVPYSTIYRGVYPFLLALVACVILLFIFPGLVTWLPSLFYK